MSNMKKPDNKPMIAYVVIVIVAMLLINALLVPAINSRQVQDVAYSKFLDMLDEKQIQKAQVVSDEYIIFQDQDGNLYKTTQMNDPDLVSKMHEQGVIFE